MSRVSILTSSRANPSALQPSTTVIASHYQALTAFRSTPAASSLIPCSMVSVQANPFAFRSNHSPDTFSSPVLLNPPNSATPTEEYPLSATGIAWPGEAKKYVYPVGEGHYPSYDSIVPPPNWALRYPNGYSEENPPPDLHKDERFQNWMRTAGLPTFTKLYGRNDEKDMVQGTYRIVIGLSQCLIPVFPDSLTDLDKQISPSSRTKERNHSSSPPSPGSVERTPSLGGRMWPQQVYSCCSPF